MPTSQLTSVRNNKLKLTIDRPISQAIDIIHLSPDYFAKKAIETKHAELGGNAGFLGVATENIGKCPDGKGSYQRFTNGMIYFTAKTGAQEVHGRILDKWASLGYETSFLGYPLHEERGTPDGIGRYSRFQGGMIYWTPDTDAHEVHGEILRLWSDLGFERSYLGYPLTDELDLGVNAGRFNNFQYGQIAWSPASGVSVSNCNKDFNVWPNGGLQPQGLGPDNVPEIRRLVTVSAHMELTDDETFGSNEHGSQSGQGQVYITNKFAMGLISLVGKAGGEMRVELNADCIATVEGDVILSGKIKLFEGTSEETDDLDGTVDISLTVIRDGILTQTIHVRNNDEGGDFADITLTVTNFAA
jgi:hypothetical protein